MVSLHGCGSSDSSSGSLEVSYKLAREYTGLETNTLSITAGEGSEDKFEFSLSNTDAEFGVAVGFFIPLSTQEIEISYSGIGVYSTDLKIQKIGGQPIIFEVLNWEYSDEVPDVPVVSFSESATSSLSNKLLISDSRSDNTSDIWVGGSVSTTGKSEIIDEGYWQEIGSDLSYVSVTLSEGDGVKNIDSNFRNAFGNESGKGVAAQIILKQSPPSNCTVVPLSTTINDNKLSLLMKGTDPYQLYYTVSGAVKQVIDKKKFSDDEIVFVYVEPSPGEKNLTVNVQDIAGNFCPETTMTILLDPDYVPEGISVDGLTYWSETENITVDVLFRYFPSQAPIQIKITGDVSGPSTGVWLDDAQNVSLSLSPTTTGSRTILAQYRDANGDESYLISKKIYLKPVVTLSGSGAVRGVVVANMAGLDSVTIAGCVEAYTAVVYAVSYSCTLNAATVDVTYNFPDSVTLVKSANP